MTDAAAGPGGQLYSLAVFAKSPESAPTKTRLQPMLGVDGARRAHTTLVQHTLRSVARVPGVIPQLWVSAEDDTTRAWACASQSSLWVQSSGDLGQRMVHAFDAMFSEGADIAGIIGTDCPSIEAQYIERAYARAAEVDLVLAPAEDGGYGMILLGRPLPQLFVDVPWGTSAVLSATLQRAEQLGLSVAEMPLIWDVDEPQDWLRYQAMLKVSKR